MFINFKSFFEVRKLILKNRLIAVLAINNAIQETEDDILMQETDSDENDENILVSQPDMQFD